MEIKLEKMTATLEVGKFANEALYPEGLAAKPHQLIRMADIVGRRDPLTEVQQKIIIAAIVLVHDTGRQDSNKTTYTMEFNKFVKLCDINRENMYKYLVSEFEKILRKGVWLYDEKKHKMTRTLWFQAVEYTKGEISFQFAEKILPLVINSASDDDQYQLVKGLQYKGKHTLAVFEVIWAWKAKGVIEYSIPQLMQQLSLEHTRYSYGQLKLRVLEPALEEIYSRDDAIFVRFGPVFSGRKVEGVWFEVTTGEAAKTLRKNEPEFKFSRPEQRPT